MAADTTTAAPSIPKIGDAAPDFTAVTTQGEITFSSWASDGKWVIFFSHPADFTPVCSTELSEFARRSSEFEKRNAKLIGLSIDSIHAHVAWRENLQQLFQTKIAYPMIADNGSVAGKYGMIHPGASSTVTVRCVFVIDPKRTVRAIIYYPLNVGRNIDEIVRLLDALQTADKHGVACPVNWKPGDKVIVPPPKTEKDVADRLALKGTAGVEQLDFYLTKKTI